MTISIVGNGFLRHMVRIIVGTLLEVGLGKEPPSMSTKSFSRDMGGRRGYRTAGAISGGSLLS